MYEVYFFSLLLAAVSNSILIIILLRRTEHSAILSTFVILLLLVNIWAVPQLMLLAYKFTGDLFIAIDKISAIGYVFIPVSLCFFSLTYANKFATARHGWFITLVYFPSVIFLYLAWNTNLIETRIFGEIQETAWGYRVPTGPLFSLFVLWFETVSMYTIVTIFRTYQNTVSLQKKKQALLLIIAMIIPILFGTISNGILPALHIPAFPVAIPLTSITAVIITYAIFRYGLFELSSTEILSSIGNGVLTINNQQKIIMINTIAKELLGLRHEQVTEKSLGDIISIKYAPNHHEGEQNPINHVLSTGKKIVAHDFIMKSKKRKAFSAECTISPMLDNDIVKGVTIVFRDNTHEKAVEKSKNEFISIASHELKTPLTSVIAFSQILEKNISETDDTKNKHIVNSMNQQLGKMKNLIEDLLNISRMESGMFFLNKKEHSIDDLVNKTVRDMQYTCATHKLIKIGSTRKKLVFDMDRIHQVLVNLISNAIKYSPKAKEVHINIQEQEKGVMIRVRDFGIGIQKKDQQKIFERFYRSSKLHKTPMAGFGLGLYICAEIIRNHKGKLQVTSTANRGSTFSFYLPYSAPVV